MCKNDSFDEYNLLVLTNQITFIHTKNTAICFYVQSPLQKCLYFGQKRLFFDKK